MKKFVTSLVVIATFLMPITALASTWYSMDVTLPRTGTWSTIDRNATSDIQLTSVSSNKYDVYSWIELNTNDLQVGPTRKWPGDKPTSAQYHVTGVNGSSIHATFKTGFFNYYTTTAHIAWQP